MSIYVIETKDLTRRFGELVAVNSVSLEVRKGEMFGLLGPNGAGKTTLLRLLTGQLEPTNGGSRVLGIDPSIDSVGVKSKIGIVPEVESIPSFLTGKEYLHYIGLIRNLEGIEEKARYWTDFLDLHDLQDVLGKDMSKGMKQRLMLAGAFVHRPTVLFLDEPFIGLDPNHQKRIRDYLNDYLGNGGSVFLCTHILELAEKICTRIGIINRGRVVVTGTLEEITQKGETLDAAFIRHTRVGS